MLLLAELAGMEFGETANDGDSGQLWLGRQPALDQPHVRQCQLLASGPGGIAGQQIVEFRHPSREPRPRLHFSLPS
jgi:hypothetical protein